MAHLMCNATLDFCRPCFKSGRVFSRLEDQSHCCSFNLASVESFIEHVFLSIEECPPGEVEWASSALVSVGVGVVAAVSLCGFGYFMYKKCRSQFSSNYNLSARLERGQVAIENPVFNETTEAIPLGPLTQGAENASAADAYDSLSGLTDVPLLGPVFPSVYGGSSRNMAIAPAATTNAQLAVMNNDEGLTDAELRDFRVLRDWADRGSRYTRRHTRQKESEVTEISYL